MQPGSYEEVEKHFLEFQSPYGEIGNATAEVKINWRKRVMFQSPYGEIGNATGSPSIRLLCGPLRRFSKPRLFFF